MILNDIYFLYNIILYKNQMLSEHEKIDYIDSNIIYETQGNVRKFYSNDIEGTITYDMKKDIFTIIGTTSSDRVEYFAANPLWKNYSYSGSGLPYPNWEIAYDRTINHGFIGDKFNITLYHPSEYYINQGKTLLKPHVHFKFLNNQKIITLIIADYLPYRSLKNLPTQPDRTIGR